MKSLALALSVLAVMGLTACTQGGSWTPMSSGRTAGSSDYSNPMAKTKSYKADKSFSKAMHK